MMTTTDIRRAALPEERVRAFHTARSEEAERLLARAARYRSGGDHAAAGMLERDAAGLVRMAQHDALIAIVARRLEVIERGGRWMPA